MTPSRKAALFLAVLLAGPVALAVLVSVVVEVVRR